MTLYKNLKSAESLNTNLKHEISSFEHTLEKFQSLPGYFRIVSYELPEINIGQVQKELMKKYEKNPILTEAIKGTQTIEDSLNELGQISKGFKGILPRRKDKIHNERVNQMSELVGYVNHLKSKGIFYPDNFITAASEFTCAFLPTAHLLSGLFETSFSSPEQFHMMRTLTNWTIVPLGSIMGGIGLSSRSTYLPSEEAKYLDGKVKELY